ncbi:MAG: acyl-CoA thioesterase [Gammaproteobacteria bacterium]|nr:acyl-CoA thioesterase [Gammaproteobacteria bacterium]MDH5660844.1 acyl-CoA thioesterase [Gammaproteobacteria bacterium]
MNKIFEYKTTVTIGDTNAQQNMYFLNFFRLQGVIRELFIKKHVNNGFQDLINGMIIITKDARCNFIKDFYLYDDIIVKLNFTKIRKTSVRANFEFVHSKTKELHAKGSQTIVFADSQHKIIKIPDNWAFAAQQFFVET